MRGVGAEDGPQAGGGWRLVVARASTGGVGGGGGGSENRDGRNRTKSGVGESLPTHRICLEFLTLNSSGFRFQKRSQTVTYAGVCRS